MKILSTFELSSLSGEKATKKSSAPVEPKVLDKTYDNKTETLTLICRRRGTSPETVDFIKNIVVNGLQFILFPFTQP